MSQTNQNLQTLHDLSYSNPELREALNAFVADLQELAISWQVQPGTMFYYDYESERASAKSHCADELLDSLFTP